MGRGGGDEGCASGGDGMAEGVGSIAREVNRGEGWGNFDGAEDAEAVAELEVNSVAVDVRVEMNDAQALPRRS